MKKAELEGWNAYQYRWDGTDLGIGESGGIHRTHDGGGCDIFKGIA